MKVFDWKDEESYDFNFHHSIEFDQLENYYDNFGDYVVTKKECLQKFFEDKRDQVNSVSFYILYSHRKRREKLIKSQRMTQ